MNYVAFERHSRNRFSIAAVLRKPVDHDEELRWISQEVRGYVEAVLSSLTANVPKLRAQFYFQVFLNSFPSCNV
jgi:dynamin 1/3